MLSSVEPDRWECLTEPGIGHRECLCLDLTMNMGVRDIGSGEASQQEGGLL